LYTSWKYNISGDEDKLIVFMLRMAAPLYRLIEEFSPTVESWMEYEERLEFCMIAHGIAVTEKKEAHFISCIGASNFSLLRSLASAQGIKEKPYYDLVKILRDHFCPKPSEVGQWFRFNACVSKPGESVAAFVANLRTLSQECEFGDSLEVMIRDRLVFGINDKAIQKRLLAEPKLTYEKAVELAQELESADRDMQLLHGKKELVQSALNSHSQPIQKVSNPSRRVLKCFRCGVSGHIATKCRIRKDIICNKCGKVGHIQNACRGSKPPLAVSLPTAYSNPVRQIQENEEVLPERVEQPLYHVQAKRGVPPILVQVVIDGITVPMEVDTGASVSLMYEKVFTELWPDQLLLPTDVNFSDYNENSIPVLGSCEVKVEYQGQTAIVPLVIVRGSGSSLMGRNWLNNIVLDWKSINTVIQKSPIKSLLNRYHDILKDSLGTLKGYKASIYVDSKVTPKFCRARVVPYAMRDKVSAELDRLVQEGTLEPVEISDWAAPIVTLVKSDMTSVRICGDFSVTVNPVSKLDLYPIPKVEDIFGTLTKGKVFSKIDLSHAYQQVPLEKESQKFVVINTQKGLFRFTRLPFGLSSAPGIFQRVMDCLLKGIPNVAVYLDDILVTGDSEQEHLNILDRVFARLSEAGLHIKLSKCYFMKSSIEYLGHRIDESGIHPLSDKVEAIHKAPKPTSIQELKSYLGLLSYYSKFLPNVSSVLFPLYRLLRKDHPWMCGKEQQVAFEKSKKLLSSSSFLTHFDSNLPIVLSCDASAYGIGAVLAHRFPDGSEKPIGYASCTLNQAERNYSQLEKEGLSCIFGIKRFHSYVFGHPFQFVTDQKPLQSLFKAHSSILDQASARIKRRSLFVII
jgi:hypothetical protein